MLKAKSQQLKIMNNINELLDKYLEGETSHEEEAQLHNYFNGKEVKPEHEEMKDIFRYMEDERQALSILNEVIAEEKVVKLHAVDNKKRNRIISAVISVSAAVLLGMLFILQDINTPNTFAQNSVWIDGKQITNEEAVKSYANISLNNVKTENKVIEEQLSLIME